MSRRARAVQLLFFLAALGALLWLLNKVGWSNIGQALVKVGPTGALILAGLGFTETILDSMALAIVIGQRRSFHVLFLNSLGALINQILPFDLGEVAKGGLMHRTFPRGETIAGTIVWNYIFKISRPLVTLAAALIGIVYATSVDVKVRGLILGGALISFVPYLVLRLVLQRGAAVLIVRLLRFVRIVRKDPERILAKALEIDEIVAGFWRERPRVFLAAMFLQIGARIASWSSLFATLRLLGLAIPFKECALLYAAMNTAELLITLVPARLGVAEGAAFGIFKMCGLQAQTGVIMYVVLRLKSLATTGVLAPFAFLRVGPANAAATPDDDDDDKAPRPGGD
jgi:hypothetical protein